MDKNLLIASGTILLVGGAIATGAIMFDKQSNPLNILKNEEVNNDFQKIDELYFDELKNTDRYTFCRGREEIKGQYTNFVFGNEKGDVEYISDDISVFDKENNRLYILGRNIKYKYSGNAFTPTQVGQGTISTEESGSITEYYKKYSAPVRIDYNSQILNPAPERKSDNWVSATIKSVGTMMGLTQERVDNETGDAKVFCPSFSLAGESLKNASLITPESLFFEKACSPNSPTPGVDFIGTFKFECNNIEAKAGIEMAKEYEELESLRDKFNSLINSDSNEMTKENNEFKGAIEENEESPEEIQRRLDLLREEMKSERIR